MIIAQEKEAGRVPESLTLDRIVRLEFVEQANKALSVRDDLKKELGRVTKLVDRYGY